MNPIREAHTAVWNMSSRASKLIFELSLCKETMLKSIKNLVEIDNVAYKSALKINEKTIWMNTSAVHIQHIILLTRLIQHLVNQLNSWNIHFTVGPTLISFSLCNSYLSHTTGKLQKSQGPGNGLPPNYYGPLTYHKETDHNSSFTSTISWILLNLLSQISSSSILSH